MDMDAAQDEQNRRLAEAIALAEEIVRRNEAEKLRAGGAARQREAAAGESGAARQREAAAGESGAARQRESLREMPPRKMRVWRIVNIVCVCVCALALATLVFYFAARTRSLRANSELKEYVDYGSYAHDDEADGESDGETGSGAQTAAELDDALVNVDFAGLTAINSDICAWLYIPGTEVDYPVLQGTDNSYYLSHDAYGRYSPDGAIFVDAGSSSDFTDFDTVVYGHNMSGGTMFKTLHRYEDEEFWGENRNVYVYLPDRTLTYRVFAAYRTNDRHILTYNDFSDESVRRSYLDKIFSEDFDEGIVKNDEKVDVGSRVLTLSTCCGMDGKRWLVQAVLTGDDSLKTEK